MQSCSHCLSTNLLCNLSRPCSNCLMQGIRCEDGEEQQQAFFSNLFSPLPQPLQSRQSRQPPQQQQQQPLQPLHQQQLHQQQQQTINAHLLHSQPSPPEQPLDLQFMYDLLNVPASPNASNNVSSASLPPQPPPPLPQEILHANRPPLNNNHLAHVHDSSPLATPSVSPHNLLDRLQKLENYVSQYSVQISKLVGNLVSNSQRSVQEEKKKPPWHILLSLTNVVVSVRDKTLCLLGYNKPYADFFKENNAPLSETGVMFRNLLDRIDPFYTLLVLDIVKQEFPFNLMRCKLIYHFEKPKLVEVITHVDETFVWIELNVVRDNVFDDGFTIGNYEHKPTVSIPLPPDGTFEEWKNIVQQHSVKRFQKMMVKFLGG